MPYIRSYYDAYRRGFSFAGIHYELFTPRLAAKV